MTAITRKIVKLVIKMLWNSRASLSVSPDSDTSRVGPSGIVTSSFGLAAVAAKLLRRNRRDDIRLDGLPLGLAERTQDLTHIRKFDKRAGVFPRPHDEPFIVVR